MHRIRRMQNRAKRSIRKNRNIIFCVGEIALATGALIFTAKGTELYLDRYQDDNAQTIPEKAERVVKYYWPAALCYGGFVTLQIFDCMYTQRQMKAYAGALMAAQGALGITGNDILKQGTAQPDQDGKKATLMNTTDTVYKVFYDENELPKNPIFAKGYAGQGEDYLFYIPAFGISFYSDPYDVANAETKAKLQLESKSDLYFTRLAEYLGIDPITVFDNWFWPADNYGDDFSFEITPGMTIGEDSDPGLIFYVINFSTRPVDAMLC